MSTKSPILIIFRIGMVIVFTVPLLWVNTSIAIAYTEVGGPIISNTTWTTANSPYIVVDNVEVWEGGTLTIEPGVTIKFDSEKNLQVNGELIAQGTGENNVIFTSNQPSPEPGDWGNIEFTYTAISTTMDTEGNYISGSILQYCVVEYAGNNQRSAIEAYSLLIDHCTIRDNDARGIWIRGYDDRPALVSNNIVHNNVIAAIAEDEGGGIYAINSTVRGNYIYENRSETRHGGGVFAWGSIVQDNIISNNQADDYGGGIYARDDEHVSIIENNTIKGNSAGSGGGVYIEDSLIISNTISENVGYYGGGVYVIRSSVIDNIIADNQGGEGGGIYVPDYHWGSVNISGNTISGNSVSEGEESGSGVFIDHYGNPEIENNTIIGNRGPLNSIVGAITTRGPAQIHNNTLYGNEPYDVAIDSHNDISGTLNYWGSVSNVDILSQVYDWYDDNSLGKLLYIPYLQEPDPDAPVPHPLNLSAVFQDDSVVLQWDELPSFSTGWGYKIYYDTDSSSPPFEGTGLNEGDSPIDVGSQITYVLTGIESYEDFYFAVTAYDNLGRESWYTNVEMIRGGYWVFLPVTRR